MYDLIIVGGAVSAFSSAIYTSRRGLKVLVMAKDIGGQANFTDLIENYPGVAETGGYNLVNTMRKQAEGFGAEVLLAEVSKVKAVDSGFIVTAHNKQYKCRAVILAFGKTPRDLGTPGEEEFKGRGVSYCATCDAPLFKKKEVAVVGIGDLSIEAALLCSRYSKKVYVLSKTDRLIGHPALLKALNKKKNVEIVPFVLINKILGSNTVSGMELLNLKTNLNRHLPVSGIFVELGYVVKSDFLQGVVDLDEQGQIIVDPNQATNIPGIFAAGDATNRHYKQAVISAGEGATAGLAAYDWLMHTQGGQGLSSDWTQIKKVKN